ncbi:MAG: serpin family protein [Geobacter sp.]|nr:MAG: serpin family protein [Geobacter sp.]
MAGEQQAAVRQLAENNNLFALDLYAKIKKQQGNLFFSPYSVSNVLAMTYSGARGGTAEEMARTLHFTSGAEKTGSAFSGLNAKLNEINGKGDIKLIVANSLWPQKDDRFLPEYLSAVNRNYHSAVVPVDYRKASENAHGRINAWVQDKTQGKIRDLIPNPLPRETNLVLVNAVYFKGNWAKPFEKMRTLKGNFTRLDGSKSHASMMYRSGDFGYHETKDVKILELPYVGELLSMVLMLPNDAAGFSRLESKLTASNLESWISGIGNRFVDVELPKFKFYWGTHDLAEPLQFLGMRKTFEGQADFSGMDGKGPFKIGNLLHKAFVEVNEEGTEAAAATAAVMVTGARPRLMTFKADRPFLFLIRENSTGSILFLGRVLDPSSSQT